MVYDILADPEWDLQALLAKVSDLCKEAVAGGIFLGDIGDLADQHDVTSCRVANFNALGSDVLS